MNYIVLDTEATGLVDPEPTEVACIFLDSDFEEESRFSSLVKPRTKRITFPAMGLTGITNEMVEHAPDIDEVIDEVIPKNEQGNVVVAHNVKFDIKVLGEIHFKDVRFIDTYELAKEYVDKEESGDLKSTTLYYYLGGKPIKGAHRALQDCEVTVFVLKALLEKYGITVEHAIKISKRFKTSYKTCHFQKHSGKLWKDVVSKDKSYCKWLIENGKVTDEKELMHLTNLLQEANQ